MLTIMTLIQIHSFCNSLLVPDKYCITDIVQCLTDDSFTKRECYNEYLQESMDRTEQEN